jgi:hypothetical protein
MQRESAKLALHIRSARIGGWRDHLLPVHLEIFRDRHAGRIGRLGYTVH